MAKAKTPKQHHRPDTGPRVITSLTAPERETIIGTSDADDTWSIWTAQRPIITKLKRNPAAILKDEGHYGSTAWALFELPANLISFRSPRKGKPMSDEQRAAAGARLQKARENRS